MGIDWERARVPKDADHAMLARLIEQQAIAFQSMWLRPCDNVQMGNLSTLLNKIQPSVYYEKSVKENRNGQNGQFVEKVSRIQVKRSVEGIIKQSIVLREMIEKKEIGLIGAIYDIDTGLVEFLDETLMYGEIKHFYLDV